MWDNCHRKLFVYIPRIAVGCGGTFYVCDDWCRRPGVRDAVSEPAVMLTISLIQLILFSELYDT